MSKIFRDKFQCPKCGNKAVVYRRISSAGKRVTTYCQRCNKSSVATAGTPKVKS